MKIEIEKIKSLYRNGDLAKISITDKNDCQLTYRYCGAGYFIRSIWESNSGDYTYCRYCNTFGHEDNIKHADFVDFEVILQCLQSIEEGDYVEIFKLELL